jgi:hypothetical protein
MGQWGHLTILLTVLVVLGLSPFVTPWLSPNPAPTAPPPGISAVEADQESAVGEQQSASPPLTPEYERCTEPTGLTDMQQAVPFEDCEFVVVEILADGSLGLVSGRPELFQQILDTETATYDSPPSAAPGASSRGKGTPRPDAPRPMPAEPDGYEALPQEGFDSGLCPLNRAENPSRYDACRAGYSPPSIVSGGIVSCSPANDERTSWKVTLAIELRGGNYRNPGWEGVSYSSGSTGYVSFTVDGLGEESLNQTLPAKSVAASVSMGSMDPRYGGFFEIIYFDELVQANFSPCL